MANMVSSTIDLQFPDEEQTNIAKSILQTWTNNGNDYELYDVAMNSHAYPDVDDALTVPYHRGYIDDIDYGPDQGSTTIRIYTESAWETVARLFDDMLRTVYPELEFTTKFHADDSADYFVTNCETECWWVVDHPQDVEYIEKEQDMRDFVFALLKDRDIHDDDYYAMTTEGLINNLEKHEIYIRQYDYIELDELN